MASFFSYLKRRPIPRKDDIVRYIQTHTRTWKGATLITLGVLFLVSVYAVVATASLQTSVSVPKSGGTLIEGVIGAPHTINPILARTDLERGLATLVYDGLMRQDDGGALVPAIASSYSVSDNKLVYTFMIDPHAVFSNKKPVTSADVAFTFSLIKNPTIGYPDYDYWKDITITTPSPTEVRFTLNQPREDFLTHTTVGILSSTTWNNATPETFESLDSATPSLGHGRFVLHDITRDNGVPTQMTFTRNRHYTNGKPFLKTLSVAFFANQDLLTRALRNHTIDFTFSLSSQNAKTFMTPDFTTATLPTTQTVSLFRSTNDVMLSDAAFVKVLSSAINRAQLITTTTDGFSVPASDMPTLSPEEALAKLKPLGYTLVNGSLKKKGSDVGFSIAVEDNETLLATARELATTLQSLGLIVSVQSYDRGTFQDGVNHGIYAVFLTSSTVALTGTQAVIPLYSQSIPYVGDTRTYGISTPGIFSMVNKYTDIPHWYTKTERIWNIFLKNN